MVCCAQVNGSSIRPWWIHHHYWAMVTMALLLTLPVDSGAVQAFVRKFLWWSTFQVHSQTSNTESPKRTWLPGPWQPWQNICDAVDIKCLPLYERPVCLRGLLLWLERCLAVCPQD